MSGIGDLLLQPIGTVAHLIESRELSPVELTNATLQRIRDKEPALNSYITVTEELALRQAKLAESEILAGHYRGALHGVPVALKDLYATRGIRTTFASRAYSEWVPDFDAAATERLAHAGAVLVGKTNLSELAADGTSLSSAFGPPRNPWNTNYITGGSSGGSAAAVAAGLAFGALGSDTAMSIRQPAAHCGIVGLKPTFGRVSKYGALPLAFSLDHVGPMTRTVRDAALMLQAIAGHDPRDPASSDREVPDFQARFGEELRGWRIGIPREELYRDVDEQWLAATEDAINVLAKGGAEFEEVSLPGIQDLIHVGVVLLTTECLAFHAKKLKENPEFFGTTVLSLMESGRNYSALHYIQAQRIRRKVSEQILGVLDRYEALVLPTTLLPPCTLDGDDPSQIPLRLRNTLPFNVLGTPAISVPCGFEPSGMPIGLQLVGAPFAEARLLALAHHYEQSTDWHNRHPSA